MSDLGDYDRWKLRSDWDERFADDVDEDEMEAPWCDGCDRKTNDVVIVLPDLLMCPDCYAKGSVP